MKEYITKEALELIIGAGSFMLFLQFLCLSSMNGAISVIGLSRYHTSKKFI